MTNKRPYQKGTFWCENGFGCVWKIRCRFMKLTSCGDQKHPSETWLHSERFQLVLWPHMLIIIHPDVGASHRNWIVFPQNSSPFWYLLYFFLVFWPKPCDASLGFLMNTISCVYLLWYPSRFHASGTLHRRLGADYVCWIRERGKEVDSIATHQSSEAP